MRLECAGSYRHLIYHQRQIDMPRGVVARTAVLGSSNAYPRPTPHTGGVRLESYILDEAAHSGGSVQRSLWPLQDLDALKIEQCEIQGILPGAGKSIAGAIGHIV